MRRSLLLLILLLLSSCASMLVEGEQLICFACIHTKVKAEKKPAEAGLKTEGTQDFSDPEKDQRPRSGGEKQ